MLFSFESDTCITSDFANFIEFDDVTLVKNRAFIVIFNIVYAKPISPDIVYINACGCEITRHYEFNRIFGALQGDYNIERLFFRALILN